jgi:hypothetical protein
MGLASGSSFSSGGGGSAGLSEADVNTLIQNNSDYEFIGFVEVTEAISSLNVSEGIDNTKYGGYKFVFEGLQPNGSGKYRIRVKDGTGSDVGMYGHVFLGQNSYEVASNSESFYLYGSTSGLDNNSRMYMEVEITYNDTYIQGFAKTGYARANDYYGHHTRANFLAQTSNSFGSFQLVSNLQSGTCKVYGRRHRSAS